ncbi:aerobic-type carbon monoxide dehydrogenase small subunit (CoxS/CutS family) [Mumia flava]|uniref:Aerobic-type carbon monoxide dehydrogenase small subunit (CoxS/CutS family) n=1 Tax=Mumia flava TaxID=1348852 RepID=A0A2M9BFK1_9ACTN|nr:aerobic-type carbon monoxide dehydrogenase small subunit (CoxS/CutS family) [Mumia flava]
MSPVTEQTHRVALRVNGGHYEIDVPARRLLSDALRADLGLTGTHVGCEHGVCGACTVLVDGRPMRSCLMFAVSAQGLEITTVEGLTEADDRMSPVQQAFQDCHGLQCGFCTPGFLTTITAGLEDNPEPTREEAREMIAGNLCRCTGYQNIVESVLRAAQITRERAAPEPLVEAERSDDSPLVEAERSDDSPLVEAERSDDSPLVEAERSDDSPLAEAERSDDRDPGSRSQPRSSAAPRAADEAESGEGA